MYAIYQVVHAIYLIVFYFENTGKFYLLQITFSRVVVICVYIAPEFLVFESN